MCRATGMPRARSTGRNGELAALNTKAASGRAFVTACAVDRAVWLSVSRAFCRTAGSVTRRMPRCTSPLVPASRPYTSTR